MELGVAGKRVLVVGGSRGIGRAIAVAYAAEGCPVAVVARTEGLLRALVAELPGDGARHSFLVTDLMADGAPTLAARTLLDEHGVFDIVVHCAGGALEVRDPLSPMHEWRRVWQFNAGIAIEMNQLLVPPMVERRWGRVVHVSSISAETLRGAPPYASAKAYLNAYTKTLGRALAATGVVVSAILPGAVAFAGSYWDDHMKHRPERVSDFLRHHQAIGRMGTPEEIATFAVFLGSELASFAQAAVVPVDGGNM